MNVSRSLPALNDALQMVVQAGDSFNQASLEDDIRSHMKKHNEVISKEYSNLDEYSASNVLGKVIDASLISSIIMIVHVNWIMPFLKLLGGIFPLYVPRTHYLPLEEGFSQIVTGLRRP